MMNKPANFDSVKRPTNVSLSEELVFAAKSLGINLSQACEQGLRAQVKATAEENWRCENVAAIAASNDFADKNALPLAADRLF